MDYNVVVPDFLFVGESKHGFTVSGFVSVNLWAVKCAFGK